MDTNAKGGCYDVVNATTQIFEVLVDYLTNDETRIDHNGMKFRVNLCIFYVFTTTPFYLIDSETLGFPTMEHTIIIGEPPLGKSDHDVLINQCKQEIFVLFDNEEELIVADFRGYIYLKGEVYVFFNIGSGAPSSHPPINHEWWLVSQIIQHTPLTIFHHVGTGGLLPNKRTVVAYGTGIREHHSIYGFFYYFRFFNNKWNSETALKPFLVVIDERMRMLDGTASSFQPCAAQKRSLLYGTFFFKPNDQSLKGDECWLCVKDYRSFVLAPFVVGVL
jgi:hypothetical protein